MHLLIGLTEALARLNSAKPQGGIVTLLDPPMTLLNRIAQAGDHLVLHVSSKLFFNGARIGVESIGEYPFWGNIGNAVTSGNYGRETIGVFRKLWPLSY